LNYKTHLFVIPALPARQSLGGGGSRNPDFILILWIPAFAGMTEWGIS